MHLKTLKYTTVVLLFTIILIVKGKSKIVSLDVPAKVKKGSEVQLNCLYDMGNATLYSLKWFYRINGTVGEEQEFYRFTPRDKPRKQVFSLKGLDIDYQNSNGGTIRLRVTDSMSGTYKCEIATEGTFHTVAAEKLMTVEAADEEDIRKVEKKIIDTLLDTDYDSRIRPKGVIVNSFIDGPVIVRTNIFVRNIEKVDDNSKEFSVQLTFRQQWNDNRLVFNDRNGQIRYLLLQNQTRIWTPDVFFSNEKRANYHNIMQPNLLMRIYPNGNVLYSSRLSLTLNCPMSLSRFPFDEQTCTIRMSSYGFTTDDLVLLWKEGDPVQITKNLHLNHFHLKNYSTAYCTSRTNTGEFSCMEILLSFEREFSYYRNRYYIPIALLVIVSWIPFWINAIKGNRIRLIISIAILICYILKMDSISNSLPETGYTTALDVWIHWCLAFIFGTVLQSLILMILCEKISSNLLRAEISEEKKNIGFDYSKHQDETALAFIPTDKKDMSTRRRQYITSNTIRLYDIVSKILFPLLYSLFVLCYSLIYRTQYIDQN